MGPEVNPGVPLPTLKHKGFLNENTNRERVALDPGRVREQNEGWSRPVPERTTSTRRFEEFPIPSRIRGCERC